MSPQNYWQVAQNRFDEPYSLTIMSRSEGIWTPGRKSIPSGIITRRNLPGFTFQCLYCLLFFGAGVLIPSCTKNPAPGKPVVEDKATLISNLHDLDAFMRSEHPLQHDTLPQLIRKIREELIHTGARHKSYDAWSTTVGYQWNADSTVIMIHAVKTYPVGFSREEIIHAGDSTLFLHRFSTHPLALEAEGSYTLLESIYYLAPTGTIRHLSRIQYGRQHLHDTVSFREQPFTDLTDEVSHFYSMELNYSRHILD